ncbi:hypothetical protein ACN2XU_18560 [Primorskyibacter sp. 2E107]
MRDLFADLWHRMNPAEPEAFYLVKFALALAAIIVLGWAIGHGWF